MRRIGQRMTCMTIAALVGLMPGVASQAVAKPLKIFILAGQSNMQGHANKFTFDSMADDPKTAPILKEMRDANGTPRVCKNVWISSVGCAGDGVTDVIEKTGKLTAGFGASENEIGPEFTFGIYMEKMLDGPILIIKTAWGGKDLSSEFRPPSAPPVEISKRSLDWAKQHGDDLKEIQHRVDKTPRGISYRLMIEHVRRVLADIKRVVPEYDPRQGYELAGFVWFQGFNDYINEWAYDDRDQPGGYAMYTQLLTLFIRDVRKDLSAPQMPFVIGVMGIDGMKPGVLMQHFREAQVRPTLLPEFKGNVVAVETAPFWDDDLATLQARAEKNEKLTPEEEKRLKAGASNGGYHYLGAAKIMAPIGKAFAEAMANLLPSSQAVTAGLSLSTAEPVDMATRAQELKSLHWGMFICWSFSTFSGKEWTPGVKDVSFFKATELDTEQWARTAKEAGMGYILFLTKHHDGFCLWDTKTTDRKITKAPLGRDVLAELRKSCDKFGIKLALYFSEGEFNDNKDYHPGGYTSEMKKAQLKELLTHYGPIEYIWFDHAQTDGGLDHVKTVEWCHQWQPRTLIGFNHGQAAGEISLRECGKPGTLGDTTVASYNKDNEATYKAYLLAEFTYPILPAHEGGAMWFYSLPKHDNLCMPAEKLYKDYRGAVKYGNIFSIDVGPDYNGKLRKIDVETLRKVGEMIKQLPLPVSLSEGKPAKASSVWGEGFEADKAFDGDDESRWGAASDSRAGWLEVDLGKDTEVGCAVVNELGYNRTEAFTIECREGDNWKELVKGKTIAGEEVFRFAPVTARYFRLNIQKAKDVPTIAEFQLSGPVTTIAATAEKPAVDPCGDVVAIRLDSTSPGRVFEGIGAVSAGASTRLLPDYPEPQRGQILDFLFKPRFGAGFQHLKVEIGSGENSTCGSEPSHVVTRAELADPKPRGYEFWLMAEARKRNPKIILDCLPWAYPAWVSNRFSPASADWFAAFLQVARKKYGLELEWIAAAQNEMGTDLNWIRKDLRPALDAQGFSKVNLQAPDNNGDHWQIFNILEKDPELDRLIGAVGYHYLDGRDPWEIDQEGGPAATEKAKRSGKPLWASEEWSQSGAQWGDKGALYLARMMNKLYTRDRITKFEIWCPIDSIYDQIIWADTGAMQADTPWCGHYTVWPAVWAIAHTTQFAEPGWVYVDGACGQMDTDTWRGSHVALRNPETGDWSVVIVTGEKRTIRLNVLPGLKNGPVHVWKSTASAQFIEQPSLSLSNNSVELELEPDAIYTITSTTGQQRGSHGTPPPRKPFPFPFEENFETYHAGDTPRYFSDQKGTFEVCQSPKGGLCLAQIVPAEGILWFAKLLKPHTLFGDTNWRDCVIEADVLLAGGDVEIGGRYANRDKLGYRWILTRDGRWQLDWQSTSLASGRIKEFKPADWHHLRLELNGDRISGAVDGKPLAAVTDASRASGMAFLSSTYDHNLFDNVRIGPLPTASQTVPDGRTIAQN